MRRSRLDGPESIPPGPLLIRPQSTLDFHEVREAGAVAELFVDGFRRGLRSFFPQARIEPAAVAMDPEDATTGRAVFRFVGEPAVDQIELFGARYRVGTRDGRGLAPQERRMIGAIGAVLELRYRSLFQIASPTRLELYQGGNDDHHIAAFIEPGAYTATEGRAASRIAATIQTLRTAALSTYENRRISTGALLLGPRPDPARSISPTAADALTYGVELTGLKSLHRLCDGKRTLFLVDPIGKLAGIVEIGRFAAESTGLGEPEVPCARAYQPHAQATRREGHVCLVLSPNQEIKVFAEGVQAFAFAHGRWRLLDAGSKFAVWGRRLKSPALARVLFQAALNLAEARHGALLVVLDEPEAAAGRLIAPQDLLANEAPVAATCQLAPHDPLAKRALHYLARGRGATEMDLPVLEALASLDGALATGHDGRLIAFGAILRHDAADLSGLSCAEGARTTAALVASRFGPVLKVSEDGVVSCFLDGARVWDL